MNEEAKRIVINVILFLHSLELRQHFYLFFVLCFENYISKASSLKYFKITALHEYEMNVSFNFLQEICFKTHYKWKNILTLAFNFLCEKLQNKNKCLAHKRFEAFGSTTVIFTRKSFGGNSPWCA